MRLCVVWSPPICTLAAAHAEINQSTWSWNQDECPSVRATPASSWCAENIFAICHDRTGAFALQHASTAKLKYALGSVGEAPLCLLRSRKPSISGGMESSCSGVGESPVPVVATGMKNRNCCGGPLLGTCKSASGCVSFDLHFTGFLFRTRLGGTFALSD